MNQNSQRRPEKPSGRSIPNPSREAMGKGCWEARGRPTGPGRPPGRPPGALWGGPWEGPGTPPESLTITRQAPQAARNPCTTRLGRTFQHKQWGGSCHPPPAPDHSKQLQATASSTLRTVWAMGRDCHPSEAPGRPGRFWETSLQ